MHRKLSYAILSIVIVITNTTRNFTQLPSVVQMTLPIAASA